MTLDFDPLIMNSDSQFADILYHGILHLVNRETNDSV